MDGRSPVLTPSALRPDAEVAERLPGLERLRAVGALLVVALHGGITYLRYPFPGLAWPYQHPAPDPVVDAVCLAIETFVMPLFLLMSGFVAAQSLDRRGPEAYWESRQRRILWPFLAAATVLLPLELYLWVTGWVINGQLPFKAIETMRLGPFHRNLWGVAHLWYLEYLLCYSLLLLPICQRWGPQLRLQRQLLLRTTLATLGVVCLINWRFPQVVLGFQHGFLPDPAKFVYCGAFFAWGVAWYWSRQSTSSTPYASLSLFQRWLPIVLLTTAAIIWPMMLPAVHRGLQPDILRTQAESLLLAGGLAAYTCTIVASLFTLACRQQSGNSPAIKELAQASFWIYLIHHPWIAAAQIAFGQTALSAGAQFLATIATSLAISVISYRWFVRGTMLGAFLDGRLTLRHLRLSTGMAARSPMLGPALGQTSTEAAGSVAESPAVDQPAHRAA